MVTLNMSRCFPCRSRLLLNQSWCLLRCSWCSLSHLLEQPPGSRRSRIGAVVIVRARARDSWVHSRRGSLSVTLCTFFLLIFKDGGAELIISCNFKDKRIARCSLVKSDFTSLSDDVSINNQHTVRFRVRSITEKNTVRRARLKLIKISIFQHKAPAIENSEMVNTGLASKPQLIRSHVHESTQENAVGHVTSGVNRLSPVFARSPMLIEHRSRHFNQHPILPLYNSILLWSVGRRILVFKPLITAKDIKTSVFEFCAIVRADRSHGLG